MDSASAKPLEQMLSRCRESRFTGEVRVRTDEGDGLIRFLSGSVEGTVFDSLNGDAAIERIQAAGSLRFEAVRELPPIAGYDEPLPADGRLGVFSPVDLMRYCEEQALSCVLEMRAVGKVVRATYEVGELLTLQPEADMTMSLLEAREGTYRVVLPKVDASMPPPTPPAVTAPPRPIRGSSPTQSAALPSSRPALPALASSDSVGLSGAPNSGADTLRPYKESEGSTTSPFDPKHFLATLKPPEDPAEQAPQERNPSAAEPGAAEPSASPLDASPAQAVPPEVSAPNLPEAAVAAANLPESPLAAAVMPEPGKTEQPAAEGSELLELLGSSPPSASSEPGPEAAAGRELGSEPSPLAQPTAPSLNQPPPSQSAASVPRPPPPRPRTASPPVETDLEAVAEPASAVTARPEADSVPPPELGQLLDRARAGTAEAPFQEALADSVPAPPLEAAPLGFGPPVDAASQPLDAPDPWGAQANPRPKLPVTTVRRSGGGRVWLLVVLLVAAVAVAVWLTR